MEVLRNKKPGVTRLRGSAEYRKALMKTLSDWPSEKEQLNRELEIQLAQTRLISAFLARTDLMDLTFTAIFEAFKHEFPDSSCRINKFKEELKLLGYSYKVSKRQFHKPANHSKISFKAFNSILQSLKNSSDSVLFSDASTFSFEVNPRRAWQSKKSHYSSTRQPITSAIIF